MTIRQQECVIVGGGAGGLTGAIYLARYLRDVVIFDDGQSRLRYVPRSNNCPGHPDGIPGPELLERLRDQSLRYGAIIRPLRVDAIERRNDGTFYCTTGKEVLLTRTVLLATGAVDVLPPLADLDTGLRRGLIRFCPACDAFEVRDRRIALISKRECSLEEAMLLRSYTADLALLSLDQSLDVPLDDQQKLEHDGIEIVTAPIASLSMTERELLVHFKDDVPIRRFDTMYSALGLHGRSDLNISPRPKRDETGMMIVNHQQCTSIPGLYAVGDAVQGFAQIAVAMGQAAIAASTINQSLGHRPRARSGAS